MSINVLSFLKACNCHPYGMLSGSHCSNVNGSCGCRDNVEGERCDRCKEGYFNLSGSNPLGCQGNQ